MLRTSSTPVTDALWLCGHGGLLGPTELMRWYLYFLSEASLLGSSSDRKTWQEGAVAWLPHVSPVWSPPD